MTDESMVRLARTLLELYGKEETFDVDVLDEATAARLFRALEGLGCKVTQEPFKSCLTVVCGQPPVGTK